MLVWGLIRSNGYNPVVRPFGVEYRQGHITLVSALVFRTLLYRSLTITSSSLFLTSATGASISSSSMVPTNLIVGSTGNSGRSVVETLSSSFNSSDTLSGYRILALTRSINSEAAQKLAKLPGVEALEQNWVDITADWLREHEVVRVFIAS